MIIFPLHTELGVFPNKFFVIVGFKSSSDELKQFTELSKRISGESNDIYANYLVIGFELAEVSFFSI